MNDRRRRRRSPMSAGKRKRRRRPRRRAGRQPQDFASDQETSAGQSFGTRDRPPQRGQFT